MGESMAIFPDDMYDSRKTSDNLEHRASDAINQGVQIQNVRFAQKSPLMTQQHPGRISNGNMILPATGSGPSNGNNNSFSPVTSPFGIVSASVPTLSEIESMMYAHVGQRLLFATENNNRPLPAMHYQCVTSSGLIVERPGSPMVHRSVVQETNSLPSRDSKPRYVSSPMRLSQADLGLVAPSTVHMPVAQQSEVQLSQGYYVHRPHPEHYASPACFENIQRPSRPKAPSPDSIHKDLLLPLDATDAEVEQNLRAREQNIEVGMGTGHRELVLSPPGIFHGQNIPGIFLTQTSAHQNIGQNTFVMSSTPLGYSRSMTSNVSYQSQTIHSESISGFIDQRKCTDDGKMKVTDLDQDLDYEQDTRITRPESPVPDLIDDTRSGQPVQQISVITALPDLLKENNADCMRRVVPKVREVLYVAGQDMQLAACNSFLQTLQQKLVPVPSYTSTFLQTIITSLNNKDPDIANAWLETLLDVIDLLPKDVIKKEILTVAINKGQLSQPVQSRLTCCQILGKIATKFEPFVIKKDILPIVQSLCQDIDYEVRACMCRQLDPVARGLGLEQTKSAILPELLELTNDEESLVRLAGIETVVKILTLLDDETRTNTIIPLVCKFCQQSVYKEDITLPFVAKQIGKLAHELQTNLTDEQKRWFIDYYKKLCRLGVKESDRPSHRDPDSDPAVAKQQGEEELVDQTVETRKNAAFNFPAMVLFVGSKHFKAELFQTLNALVSDPDPSVRKSVAMGFHEVVKALNNNCFLILNDLITLYRDDSLEVFQGLVTYMPETLETYTRCLHNSTTHVEVKQATLQQDLVTAMLQCEAVISNSNNWRLQKLFLEKLSCLTTCYPSELIYTQFVPLLFRKLTNARALPVKHAAGQTLLVLFRNIEKLDQRKYICLRLVEDLCNSHSCYLRCLFIDVCSMIMNSFSKAFFKEYFFEYLLRLSKDRVPNVRLKLCKLFPRLKKQIKLPKDRNLLQQLETCVRKLLMSEKDKDTYEVLEKAVKEFDQITVLAESVTKKPQTDEDLQDAQKEEDEQLLIEKEEREKEEEAKQVKPDKKKDSNKKEGQTKPPASKRGSKVPAATSITKSTAITTGGVRTERSGSFAGSSSGTNSEKKSSSSTNKPSRTSRTANTTSPAPASNRKGSASSVSSNTSLPTSTSSSRRSSTGSTPNPGLIRKNSSSSRRISTGSDAPNGVTSKHK